VRPNFMLVFFALSIGSLLLGCPGKSPVEPVGGGGSANLDGGTTGGGSAGDDHSDGGVGKSSKSVLRFKGPERLGNDFSKALSIAPQFLCNELGLYPCTTVVHALALGGVDPYGNGVYESPALTGVTAPIVVDRIALTACASRAALDVTYPALAVVFKGLPLERTSKISNPSAPEVVAAIDALYQRILLRRPTAAEISRLQKLVTDIESTGSQRPAFDWMIGACFSTITSSESVLY
jgi:hypothetical protein